MAALNHLESDFNAKLVLSKCHAVSRALSLTQGDKTIHNQSSNYSYPRCRCHCFVYAISLQIVWKQAHPQRQNHGTLHIIGTRGHGVDLRWGEMRRTQKNAIAARKTQEQSSSWYSCYTLTWAIGFHTLFLISKHQSLLCPTPYFKSSISSALLGGNCHF